MADSNIPQSRDDWQRIAGDLEKIVNRDPDLFSDTLPWIRGMVRAMWAVCRIESPLGRAWGTGFLVGPDLVVTNSHVVVGGGFRGSPGDVRCRFGFQTRTDGSQERGKTYPLAANAEWLIHSSPSESGGLDYAVLKLASKAGLERIDDVPTSPQRGWVRVAVNAPAPGQSLFALQHPSGDTLKLAFGQLQAVSGPWLSYQVNTEYGSSGSPVFDNRWELVALHSRRDTDQPLNKGVLFSAILQNLPGALRDEIRGGVPPANTEISVGFLAGHELSPAKVEAGLVQAHLAKLDDDEMKLLAGAIFELARGWTSGRSADGTCELGSGRRLLFRVNHDAIVQRGQVTGLKGTLELVEANEAGLQHKRQAQMSNLNPGVNWPWLIAQQTKDLEDVRNELRGKLPKFLILLRTEPGA
jgi:hypothetical protein